MKKILFLFWFFFIQYSLQSQGINDTTSKTPSAAFVFPLGAKFTIRLHPVDSTSYHYTIEKYTDFHEYADLKNPEKYFKTNQEENTIEAIFCIGTYGLNEKGEQDFQSSLLIKNGTNKNLFYKAEIQEREKVQYEPTPVLPLLPNRLSVETWAYPIGSIALINFENFNSAEIVKDSTCVTHPNYTVERGDSIFSAQIKMLKKEFLSKTGIKLNNMKAYEKTIKSREPMFFSVAYMQNRLYPNKKNYKLEIPFLFKRVECPTFTTNVLYYYTKNDNLVKSILFEWSKFEGLQAVSYSQEAMEEEKRHFNEKVRIIETEVTKLLGEPRARKKESENTQIIKYEDSIQWESPEGIHVDLQYTGTDRERKIQIIMYKE